MEETDLGEMLAIAIYSKESGFNRVEIAPDDLIEILNLAIDAKRAESNNKEVGHENDKEQG